MARPRTGPSRTSSSIDPSPRQPAAPRLPGTLRPVGDETAPEDELVLERVAVAWRALGAVEARGLRIVGGRADGLELGDARLPLLDLEDVVLEGGSLANADLREATWRRTTVTGARLTGVRLTDARLDDVTFRDCRIDLATFAAARLRRVVFRDCRMTGCDLQELAGEDLLLEGCDLTEVDLSDARFTRTELLGCTLEGARALDRLRGVGMRWEDVLQSAGAFAGHLGVRLVDG